MTLSPPLAALCLTPRPAITRNLTDEINRAFWSAVDDAVARVAAMPEWKRGPGRECRHDDHLGCHDDRHPCEPFDFWAERNICQSRSLTPEQAHFRSRGWSYGWPDAKAPVCAMGEP